MGPRASNILLEGLFSPVVIQIVNHFAAKAVVIIVKYGEELL